MVLCFVHSFSCLRAVLTVLPVLMKWSIYSCSSRLIVRRWTSSHKSSRSGRFAYWAYSSNLQVIFCDTGAIACPYLMGFPILPLRSGLHVQRHNSFACKTIKEIAAIDASWIEKIFKMLLKHKMTFGVRSTVFASPCHAFQVFQSRYNRGALKASCYAVISTS